MRGPGKWERKLGFGLMDLDDVDAVKTRAGTVSAASVIDVRITLSGVAVRKQRRDANFKWGCPDPDHITYRMREQQR